MPRPEPPGLSRRERQIMDILYRGRRATAAEIHQAMSDAPSYSAVRATLRILEEKGYVRHRQEGPRYLYLPTLARQKATLSAVKHLVETFFEGSAEKAVATLLDSSSPTLSEAELERIADLVEKARKRARPQSHGGGLVKSRESGYNRSSLL